ncbi:MAG: hypothetical protein R3240_14150, partial [Gammaproteobacteria bacterium]|nr:hypothetical protein [Gammaproteobacteria bacterium]
EPMNGPEVPSVAGIVLKNIRSIGNGAKSVIVVPNGATQTIDAYVMATDGSWESFSNINQNTTPGDVHIFAESLELIAGSENQFLLSWKERFTNANGTKEDRYMTVTLHSMVDSTTGMTMWHWMGPSELRRAPAGSDMTVELVIDSQGTSYAVWSAMLSDSSKSMVYVNHTMDGVWMAEPEMLVEYDARSGVNASNPDITINNLDMITIAWIENSSSATNSYQKVWVVEKQ